MSQTTLPVPPRPRPRRWRRRLLLTLLFLVLAGAGGVLYCYWSASSDLNGIIAELDRHDPGWRLYEIEASRKAIPDAQNSALHILAINKLLGGQSVHTGMNAALEESFFHLPPQVQLNDQQAAFLNKRLEVLRPALLEARKLKDMPDGRFPLIYSADVISTNVTSGDARVASDLLLWDAVRRVHGADADGALESCLGLQHAARSIGDEPMLISLLIRVAINAITVGAIEQTLAQGNFTAPSEPTLKRMQAALAKELSEPTLVLALRGERAWAHGAMQGITEGKTKIGSLLTSAGGGLETMLLETFPGYFTRQHAALLRFHTKIVEAAKLPPELADQRIQELDKSLKDEPSLVRMVVPALMKVINADRRTRANLCCAMTALATERFRIAQNRWPESLDVLVKSGFLDGVPIDPYDAKPIRLKRTDDGLLVYSVGQDRIDNGGVFDRDRPLDPGNDLVFQLWDISRCRQPPNPPVAENEDLLK